MCNEHKLIARLMKQSIYDLLSEEQLSRTQVVHFEKNTIFIPAVNKESIDLYYILDGVVEVISQAYNGRSFLIDTVEANEFIGKFSNIRQQNFYSDIKTRTACKMLKLTAIRNELLNDEDFLLFFCLKTSNRLYEMYKIGMMRTLFTYEEILAYCLICIATADGFISAKDQEICLKASISERQYYYIIKKFKNNHIIANNKKGMCILNLNTLKDIAVNVANFMENRI